jgi:hypothetical protein
MTTALEAIREELTTMREHISCLERAEVIIRPVYEPTEPPRSTTPTPPPAKPAPTRRRRPTCQNRTSAELREYVVAHGPLTRGELVAALGGNAHAMDQSLARLLAAGKIAADGRPRELRYRSPHVAEVVSAPSVPAEASAAHAAPERGVYPMYDAIVDLDGASTQQLSRRMELPTSLVVEQGRRLVQLGLVRFTQAGQERVWRATRAETVGDAA